MEYIALDLANSFVKVSTVNKSACYINRYRDTQNGGYSLLSNQRDDVFEFNGLRLSLDDNGDITSSSRSSERYASSQFLFESLIAITKVTNKDYVSLLVGLPCSDMDSQSIKQSVRDNLVGNHSIVVNGITRTITIKEVELLEQPMGTLMDLMLDSNLNVNQDLLDFKLLTIDLGYGTCDLVSSVGHRIQWTKGVDVGSMTLVNKYLELINAKSKTSQIEFKISDIGVKPQATIKKYQQVYDFSNELDNARKLFIQDFKSQLSNLSIKFSDFDCVIFTGGGVHELLDGSHYELAHNCLVVESPQTANVSGLLKYLHYIKRGH